MGSNKSTKVPTKPQREHLSDDWFPWKKIGFHGIHFTKHINSVGMVFNSMEKNKKIKLKSCTSKDAISTTNELKMEI